jgi:hypothetical protein
LRRWWHWKILERNKLFYDCEWHSNCFSVLFLVLSSFFLSVGFPLSFHACQLVAVILSDLKYP